MNLSGVFPPIPTPFTSDDQVDTAALKAAVGKWVRTPLTGIVVLGSNGEAAFLDDEESARAIGAVRDAVPAGRPLIAGTGRESTPHTIRATKRAAELGADAVLVRTPGFFKNAMNVDAYVRHYRAVADASPVPVLIYNFTAVTGVDIPPAAVFQLASHPNIVGMKESNADIAKIQEIAGGTPADFRLFAGAAGTFYYALAAGCGGGILALSCVVPEACVKLYELTTAGRHDEGKALQRQLVPLGRLLATNGVAGLKGALKLAGYEVGVPRSPLAPLAEPVVAAMREQIDAIAGARA